MYPMLKNQKKHRKKVIRERQLLFEVENNVKTQSTIVKERKIYKNQLPANTFSISIDRGDLFPKFGLVSVKQNYGSVVGNYGRMYQKC